MKNTKEVKNSADPNVRAKYGYREAIVSIIGNILLFLIKITFALFINSIGLLADAMHSLSDVSTSGIVIFGFKIAKKQPDKNHPFGHGRAEYIATLIIAVLLIVIGLNIIQESMQRVLHPTPLANSDYAIIIAIIILCTIIGKELMARYSLYLSKKIDSEMLKADAWHHRTDAISSIAVAIGIIGSHFGYPILDGIFGIVVSLIIIFVGIRLIKTTSDHLIGLKPNTKLNRQLDEISRNLKGITNIHSVYVHDYGHIKILTFHVEMNGDLTLTQAHHIADKLEHKIMTTTHYFPVIHVEPTGQHKSMNTIR